MPPKTRKPLALVSAHTSPSSKENVVEKRPPKKVAADENHEHIDDADEISSQNWPILLEKAVSGSRGQKTLVKRLYSNVDDVVEVCHGDDLRRALWTASFVSIPEGRKICVRVLGKIGVRSSFYLMKKSALQGATKQTCAHYGEIMLSAWKAAIKDQNEQMAAEIESEMITGAIHDAIFVSEPHSSKFSAMLSVFCGLGMKDRPKMDNMLYKCFLPVLWRALKANNNRVRYRASCILLDFYPIICDDEETKTSILDKQHEAISQMILDDCCAIRQDAATKVLKICANFWTFLPVQRRKDYLILICDKLSTDADVAVRLGVIQGLRHMLPVPICLNATEHALKVIVPLRINDKNDRVRLETFELLRRLKGHRYLKFFDVVDVGEIMARLEVETSESVRKEIIQLIFRSFFPSDADQNEKMRRMGKLTKFGRNCALNFHRLIVPLKLVTLKEAVEHVQFLSVSAYRLAGNAELVSETSKLSLLDDTVGTLSGPTQENGFDESDPKWSRAKVILECVAILYMSLRDMLADPEHEKEKLKIEQVLTKVFKKMFQGFRNTSALGTTMMIGSLLPQSNLVKEGITSCVLKLLNEKVDDAVIEPYLEATAHWDVSLLFKIISDGLNVLSESESVASPAPKKAKASQQLLSPNERFWKALHYLKYLISSTSISSMIVNQYQFELERFFEKLQLVRNYIERRFAQATTLPIRDNLLIDAYNMKQTLAVLILNGPKNSNEDNLLLFVRELCIDARWFETEISVRPEDEDKHEFWFSFCETVLQKIVKILMSWDFANVPTVSKAPSFLRPRCDDDDPAEQEVIIDFITSTANILTIFCSSSTPIELLPPILLAAKQLAVVAPRTQKNMTEILQFAPMWILKRHALGDEMDEKKVSDAFLILARTCIELPQFDLDKLTHHMAELLVDFLSAHVEDEHEVPDPRGHDYEIPEFVSILLFKVIKKNVKMFRSFRNQLGGYFCSPNLLQIAPCDNHAEKCMERLAASLQLAYLIDVDADGKSRSQSETRRTSEETNSMVKILAERVAEVEASDESIDGFLLTQVKDLIP